MRSALLLLLVSALLAAGTWATLAQSPAPPAGVPIRLPGDPPAERGYRPYSPAAAPVQHDVLYARTIVLRGPDSEIILDTSGRAPGLGGRPGMIVRSATTGQRAMLFLNADGRAVVGLAAPGREHFPLAFYLGRDGGVIQVSDRRATQVLGAAELARPDLPRQAAPRVRWTDTARPARDCTPSWN